MSEFCVGDYGGGEGGMVCGAKQGTPKIQNRRKKLVIYMENTLYIDKLFMLYTGDNTNMDNLYQNKYFMLRRIMLQ